jgi:LEA14-like dessication related protein
VNRRGRILHPNGLQGLFLLLAGLLVSGCEPLTKADLDKPEVFVKSVALTRVGPTSADLVINLSVRNTNNTELTLQGIDYDLALNNRRVLLGDAKPDLHLPAYGTVEIPLRATFEYQRVFNSISEALQKRRVVYQLNGSAGIGPFRIPFVSGGEFVLE